MTDTAGRSAPDIATVELTRDELSFLLVYTQTQYAEMGRAMENLEEEEGDSPGKWNMTRNLKRQVALLEDLSMKLEGAAKEVGWR